MIVWRFWITLKDNLPQEEIDNFRERFPNLFFEAEGLYRADIEAGLTIDIFFSTESECNSYGRRDVYMVWR